MEETKDRIYQLMTEKLAGVISAADETFIDDLIEKDPAIREKWQKFQLTISSNTIKNFKNSKTTPPWTLEERSIAHRFDLWIKVVAASVMLLLGLSVIYFFWNHSQDQPLIVSIDQTTDHIALTLADGRTINLNKEKGQLNSSGTDIENTSRTLIIKESEKIDEAAEAIALNTLTVPIGMDYKIELPDGSHVWLNSATTMKFPLKFQSHQREIYIEGEAYFDIARDENRPFIVHLPESDVEVLGTEFNVNTYDTGVDKVALIEGSVKLKVEEKESIISPGTEITYSIEGGMSEQSFQAKQVLAWQKGLFYFYDASLLQICQVLPRWYGLDIQLDNPTIKSKRFAGILDRNQPIEVFLEDLKTITQIEYYIDSEKSVLHFRIPEDK
ncbi:FecR domain-containing protein [Membranihabitans marinus]|uniref:FecR domain-containing protein n=1 Tax=Membranihabitans marinus TaxID=1227546 RepID=UPI001F22B92C|nr:FecR domain-containing protein [Membranihabitans marinus]